MFNSNFEDQAGDVEDLMDNLKTIIDGGTLRQGLISLILVVGSLLSLDVAVLQSSKV